MGWFGLFEVESSDVLINIQGITYCRWRLAGSQFGEAGRITDTGEKQYTAVDVTISKMHFDLKKQQYLFLTLAFR